MSGNINYQRDLRVCAPDCVNFQSIFFKPAKWCHKQWRNLASPLPENHKVAGGLKRILKCVPLILATLGAYLIGVVGVMTNMCSCSYKTTTSGSHTITTLSSDHVATTSGSSQEALNYSIQEPGVYFGTNNQIGNVHLNNVSVPSGRSLIIREKDNVVIRIGSKLGSDNEVVTPESSEEVVSPAQELNVDSDDGNVRLENVTVRSTGPLVIGEKELSGTSDTIAMPELDRVDTSVGSSRIIEPKPRLDNESEDTVQVSNVRLEGVTVRSSGPLVIQTGNITLKNVTIRSAGSLVIGS